MPNDQQKIKCPKCEELISIDDVLTNQIGEKIRREFEAEQKLKEKEIANQKKELDEQLIKFEETKKNAQIEINKRVSEKLTSEKADLWKQAQVEAEKQKMAEIKLLEESLKGQNEKLAEANAEALKAKVDRQKLEEERKNFELEKIKQIEDERKKIEEEAFARAIKQNESGIAKFQRQLDDTAKAREAEKKMFDEQLAEKEAKLREANENELSLRKEKNKLEEDKKNFELEKQRQLDEERKNIFDEASKKATEDQQYIIAQLKKQLVDATKAKDELARKLEQGSQQSQGEVLELELEELLKREFPFDEIEGVKKGVNGADIIQRVNDKLDRACGQIIWELKNTKTWNENYVQKLKDDQIKAKADLGVVVSVAMPTDVNGFAFRDGVFICDVKSAISLATILRYNLLKVSESTRALSGKEEKKDIVYAYINSTEFKQRIQAIAEAFISLKDDLEKEKRAYQSIWAKREKQIQRVLDNTYGVYGDLKGLTGGTIQEIKMLELPEESEVVIENPTVI